MQGTGRKSNNPVKIILKNKETQTIKFEFGVGSEHEHPFK